MLKAIVSGAKPPIGIGEGYALAEFIPSNYLNQNITQPISFFFCLID